MADSEERIYIGIINPKGDFCPVPYGTCNSLCDNCKGGITRQEAIKRIAKAFCQYTFNRTCEDCPLDGLDCEDVLEHYGLIGGSTEAYNALLKK